MNTEPLVLVLTDGQPPPGPFPHVRLRVTQDSDEACRLARTVRPTVIVVATRPELLPILISRLRDNTRQPILAVIPNEPREGVRAVKAGAYDAAVFGMLGPALAAAVDEGRRIEGGHPERLGPYEVHGILGRGGMGTVYRATDDGREIALKVLFPELAANQEFVDRFYREARTAASLSHPNLMAVYAHGRARWRLWMAMELVHGQPLDVILKDHGRMDPLRALKLVRQIARGLGYAHEQGFVHRDIKPGNLVVDDGDFVKIMDFGLLKSTTGETTPITKRDEVVGTLLYAAPEQLNGGICDGRSDLYSLGVVLFELVCGLCPFSGADSMVVIRAKETGRPSFEVRELNPTCPPEVTAIVDRLLQPEADKRFASAGQLVDSIDAAMGRK